MFQHGAPSFGRGSIPKMAPVGVPVAEAPLAVQAVVVK